MKKSLILGVIFLSLFAGCSDSGSSEKSDSDPILTDVDQDEPSAVDGDNASSESPEEKSDADPYGGAEECPDLKDAKFPYERTDGKIHFCRRCDTIADDDPQCIRNLWKENSESFKKNFPDLECEKYPCKMDNLSPQKDNFNAMSNLGDCDESILPEGYKNALPVPMNVSVENGKTGFDMHPVFSGSLKRYPVAHKLFQYDLKSKEYTAVMPTYNSLGSFYDGSALGLVVDTNRIVADSDGSYEKSFNETAEKSVYLVHYSPEKGFSVALNEPASVMKAGDVGSRDFSVRVKLRDRYATMFRDDIEKPALFYAKVGEWKWRELKNSGEEYRPGIVNGKLVLHREDSQKSTYYCDLENTPSSIDDCIKVNRKDEKTRYPRIDKSDETRVVYSIFGETSGVVEAKIFPNGKIVYKDFPVGHFTGADIEPGGLVIRKVDGDTMLYSEMYKDQGLGDIRTCLYRFSTQESFCTVPNPDAMMYKCNQGQASYEGSDLVWFALTPDVVAHRDMECYCKKNGGSCSVLPGK